MCFSIDVGSILEPTWHPKTMFVRHRFLNDLYYGCLIYLEHKWLPQVGASEDSFLHLFDLVARVFLKVHWLVVGSILDPF